MTVETDVPAGLDAFIIDAPPGPTHANFLRESDLVRFWDRVEKGAPDACWRWRGSYFNTGYPAFWLRNNNVGGHRIACAMAHGLSQGRQALHSCDNPWCVNPYHLRWGSPAENMQDRSDRGHTPLGELHKRAKLTEREVRAIRQIHRTLNTSYAATGRRYGVTGEAVSAIVNRKTWRHIP
jgi:hypothetical protein